MNAIILAAGMGTRLRPLTDSLPKSLVVTAGESFFSRQLRLLRASGIGGITVVTGYHAEAFDPWRGESGLEFIHNGHYHDRNNLFSMLLVADRLSRDPGGCIVLEGDVWLSEHVLPSAPPARSSWFVGHRDGMNKEWVVKTDAEDRVLRVDVESGSGWILTGISFWLPGDGLVLARLLEAAAMEPSSYELFWDELPRRNLDLLEVGALRIGSDDWFEVDSLEDRARLETNLGARARNR